MLYMENIICTLLGSASSLSIILWGAPRLVCTSVVRSFLLLSRVVWMCHHLFNCSLVEGQLGCFWFEAITNKAVPVFVWTFLFLWDKCRVVELLDCMVVFFCFVFLRNSQTCPGWIKGSLGVKVWQPLLYTKVAVKADM